MIDLEEIDKTVELWNSIPNNPPTWDNEEVDYTEDDWTVCSDCVLPTGDWVVTDR